MPERIVTLGVSCGAYLRADTRRAYLTHAVRVVDDAPPHLRHRPLCTKVKGANLQPDGYTDAELASIPTCEACQRRDPRWKHARRLETGEALTVRKLYPDGAVVCIDQAGRRKVYLRDELAFYTP